MEIDPENLEGFFEFVLPHLDEKQRRLVSGAMARLLGHGGTTVVAGASGLSRNTVIGGTKAFDAGEVPSSRVRREGGRRAAPRRHGPGPVDGPGRSGGARRPG